MFPLLSRSTAAGPKLKLVPPATIGVPKSFVAQAPPVPASHLRNSRPCVSTLLVLFIQICVFEPLPETAGPNTVLPGGRLSCRSTPANELLEMVGSHRYTSPPVAKSET